MDILVKSLQVLSREWYGILGILGIFLLGSGIIVLWIRAASDNALTVGEFFVLGVGGGFLPLFFGIFLIVLLDFSFGIETNFIVICLVILIISGFASYLSGRGRIPANASKIFSLLPEQSEAARIKQSISAIFPPPIKVVSALVLLLFLIISIYIRLAFISGLVVPLYFDSAMHYSIVTDLIASFKASTLPAYSSFVGGYYHLGFHVLVTALSLVLGLDVKDVILLFGQIILASIPLPLFYIIKRETQLDTPALFAALLAGWGWSLPAHAVNWGKYPALTSILTFEFVLCSTYLLLQSTKHLRWILICLFCLSILMSTFIHTRSLILIIIALISSAFAMAWYKLPRYARYPVFCLTITPLILLMFIARSKPILSMAVDPYQSGGLWSTLLILSLSPFALKEFPRAAFSSIISLLFLFSSLFVSVVRFLPAYDTQTLLDRPFVEMVLFFPLAFLGGLGYAGMTKTLQKIDILKGARQKWVYGLLSLLLFGAVIVNATQYNFFPSNCCIFFGDDDAIALDWMDKHIPANANILVASSEAIVFENTPSVQYAGSDSGVWITPLIHRNSVLLSYQTDFSSQDTVNNLCKNKITHIYLGEGGNSFNNTMLNNLPGWYEMLLRSSKVQIFKLVGCP